MLPDLRFEPDNEIMNKLTFCIHFEEHSDCQLDIDLNEQMEEAYDWEYIKKRILS